MRHLKRTVKVISLDGFGRTHRGSPDRQRRAKPPVIQRFQGLGGCVTTRGARETLRSVRQLVRFFRETTVQEGREDRHPGRLRREPATRKACAGRRGKYGLSWIVQGRLGPLRFRVAARTRCQGRHCTGESPCDSDLIVMTRRGTPPHRFSSRTRSPTRTSRGSTRSSGSSSSDCCTTGWAGSRPAPGWASASALCNRRWPSARASVARSTKSSWFAREALLGALHRGPERGYAGGAVLARASRSRDRAPVHAPREVSPRDRAMIRPDVLTARPRPHARPDSRRARRGALSVDPGLAT